MPLHELTKDQRLNLLEDMLVLFQEFCLLEFQTHLYQYQMKVARALLYSIVVERRTVFVKISRQAGKTQVLTLLLRFLILYYRHFLGVPLMAAIASPHGEQAKTDIDRLKLSLQKLRERWQVKDRENNQSTIRAYRKDLLLCEMFKFSLAPTTHNESKTLNVLAIEESHKADHQKRSDELDPMMSAQNGCVWHFGVGCTSVNDYQRGCAGQLADSLVVVVPVDEVIRDRRLVYEQTGDPSHLAYEKSFEAEVRQKGVNNPEIRRNYFLEDQVEVGGFVSRERLLGCARPVGVEVPTDRLYIGIDWARSQDSTWITIVNDRNDVIEWFKYPHVPYLEQVELMQADLAKKRTGKRIVDGEEEEYEWTYLERIVAVYGDATGGTGDAPNEMLREHSGLPVGDESLFKFTLQSKNDLYLHFESALFKDEGDEYRFTFPADHPLAGEFEEQMTRLVREYKGDGEYLSVHHPDEQGARDDAPDATALALYAAKESFVGDLLVA